MEQSLKQKIYHIATEVLGFDDCRFTDIDIPDVIRFTRKWLRHRYKGDMQYLQNHIKCKKNQRMLLPGARSAVFLIKSYKNAQRKHLSHRFKISRYAVGKDYTSVISHR